MFLPEAQELFDASLKPSAARYEVAGDFSNVINFGNVYLPEDTGIRKMLSENGFAVVPGYYDEFFTLYETNRYELIPSFITTDSMMHTYHLFFSRLLKGVEKNHFCADLTRLSQIMLENSLSQAQALAGTDWENAARRNAAFFDVGLSLLSGEEPSLGGEAAQELSLIREGAGIGYSPVMNMGGEPLLQEDYSQYTPRGYYTTSEELSRYFQAMMWYGRMSFLQSSEDQSRSALLMTLALKSGEAMTIWEKIYAVTSFFAGASDDPGVYEYAALAEECYGGLPEVSALPKKDAQWRAFLKGLSSLKPPAVNSIPIYEGEGDEAVLAFRFMGQRGTLDAAIFQQLVFENVRENPQGQRRMLPSALDVPAALGSKEAREILRQSGAEDFSGYKENMDLLTAYLSEPPETLWNGSLYGGWLNTLRPLTEEKGEGYPQFMQNKAWQYKSLNTFLGSWTELKHDTVLYAKQVYAEMGGGGFDDADDRGFVEPEPALYGRLASLSRATADGLAHYGLLAEEDRENLSRLASLAEKLVAISEKELKDQPLSDEEFELIRSYGGQLEHFWYDALKDEKGGEALYSTDFPAAVVTDVATDPNGSVLEVGTGSIDTIYVIVNAGGSLRIARGGVYSFYEFSQPISERLTDEKWRQMLGIDMIFTDDGGVESGKVELPRPAWTSLFLAE